jgi:hypothetical protein
VTLFTHVNKAWFSSAYNNASCGYYDLSSKTITHKVNFQPTCTKCLRNITLINLSGGEIDLEVEPKLTNLYEISARPRNTSTIAPSSKQGVFSFSRIIQTVTTVRNTILFSVLRFIPFLGSSSSTPANNNNSTAIDISVNCTGDNNQTCDASVNPASAEEKTLPKINPNSTYAFITKEKWEKDILKYSEPRHICYRSSQLLNIGFPIDHYAILWCKQFLQEVATAMKTLAKDQKSGKRTPLTDIFKYNNEEMITDMKEEVAPLQIEQLSTFVARNISNVLFQEAVGVENAYMIGSLNESSLWFYAVKFYLRHWHLPITYFVGLIIFSLAMKVFGLMTLLSSEVNESSYLFDLQLFVVMLQKFKKSQEANGTLFYALFALFALGFYYFRKYLTVDQIGANGILVVYHLLSLSLAIALRCFLVGMIRNFRCVLNFVLRRGSVIGQKKKAKDTKSSSSSSNSSSSSSSSASKSGGIWKFVKKSLKNYSIEMFMLSSWLITYYLYCVKEEKSGFIYYLVSFSTVIYGFLLLEFLYLMVMPARNHFSFNPETIQYVDEELILVFLWLLLTGIPSLVFSYKLLIHDKTISMESQLYEILGPDQLQYGMALLVGHFFARVFSSKK